MWLNTLSLNARIPTKSITRTWYYKEGFRGQIVVLGGSSVDNPFASLARWSSWYPVDKAEIPLWRAPDSSIPGGYKCFYPRTEYNYKSALVRVAGSGFCQQQLGGHAISSSANRCCQLPHNATRFRQALEHTITGGMKLVWDKDYLRLANIKRENQSEKITVFGFQILLANNYKEEQMHRRWPEGWIF